MGTIQLLAAPALDNSTPNGHYCIRPLRAAALHEGNVRRTACKGHPPAQL
jgi:hypothetical protein